MHILHLLFQGNSYEKQESFPAMRFNLKFSASLCFRGHVQSYHCNCYFVSVTINCMVNKNLYIFKISYCNYFIEPFTDIDLDCKFLKTIFKLKRPIVASFLKLFLQFTSSSDDFLTDNNTIHTHHLASIRILLISTIL